MASVVRLAIIVAQERHGIVLRNVFWVLLDEVCEEGRDADKKWQCEYTELSSHSPLTVFQRVGMVSMYSYKEIVKP